MLKTSLMCDVSRQMPSARWIERRVGAVAVWVLPVVVIIGLAGYLCLAPGPRRPISAAENQEAGEGSEDVREIVAAAAEGDVNSLVDATSDDDAGIARARSVERQLEGKWAGFYQGQRRLTVRSDGTCTMTAEPEGLAATLLAAKLTFEIRWKMNGEHMEFETVGGEPLDKVNVVLQMYGKKRSHKILKLQPGELVLLDEDGVTRYEWRRIASD